MCSFCEELKDVEEFYTKNMDTYIRGRGAGHITRVEHTVVLCSLPLVHARASGIPITSKKFPLNFCPECGRKIDI